jgi:hypothetical protein
MSEKKEQKPAELKQKPVSELCGESSAERAIHAAASILHRWPDCQKHMNQEMKLSQPDYDAAIKAASKRQNGRYTPHKSALFSLEKK